MITINKNSANDCYFTLNERTTLTGATYLLEIVSNMQHNSKVLLLSGDSSSDTERYNKFVITESATEVLSAATVSLNPGSYDYFAWQTTAGTTSLSAATSIVETGKLVVVGSAQTTSTFVNNRNEYIFRP